MKKNNMKKEDAKVSSIIILTVLLLGLIIRIIFAVNLGPLRHDHAVNGLISKHICDLKEFYIYVPLAHYSGTTINYVAAVLFKIFGVSDGVFHFTALLFSFPLMVVMLFIAKELLDRTGVVVTLILTALPFHLMFTFYSLFVGNFTEGIFFMLLALFIFIKWMKSGYSSKRAMPVCVGYFLGFSLWTTPNAFPLLLTVITVMAFYNRKNIYRSGAFFLIGFIAGYFPAIIYNFQYPGATLFRMGGRILDLDRSVLAAPNLPEIIIRKMLWRISQIPVSVLRMLPLTAALIGVPSAVLFMVSIVFVFKHHGVGEESSRSPWRVLCIYVIWTVIFYAVLVQDVSARYMASLCMVYPLFIGYLFSHIIKKFRSWGIALLLMLVCYNCWTLIYAFPEKDAECIPVLSEWLISKNLSYGFSDFNTAYSLQFATKEKSIISPTIFDLAHDDRWPEDTKRVRKAKEIFYIIDRQQFPFAVPIVESTCKERNINYKEAFIGEYVIYYGFSELIYPEDFSFGL